MGLNHKSQSALEYMMTYGWAILVIVIVAAVLYSLGIFSPSSSLSTTITGFSNLGQVTAQCYSNLTGSGFSQNVGLVLTFGNAVGYPINISSINVTDSILSKSFHINTSDLISPNGISEIFDIPNVCPQSGGSRFSDSVTITYTEPGQIFPGPYVINGVISGSTASGSAFPKSVGLLGFWPLSEGSGTTAYDLSGNNYNGNIVNGVWVASQKFGYALNFSTGRYVNTTYVQKAATYTVIAWVKIPTSDYGGIITNDRGSGAGHSLTLFTDSAGCSNVNGEPAFLDDTNGLCLGLIAGSYSLNTGEWYSVAGVFNSVPGGSVTAQDFSIFVNGTEVPTSTNVNGGDTSPLTGLNGMLIGYSLAWNAYFNGEIADVRVYNRTLTPNEIKEITLYNTLI